jgi:flavodoxin
MVIVLKEIMQSPTKCSIKLVATTDPIKKLQHQIVETGEVNINVIPKDSIPLEMSYVRVNSLTDDKGDIQYNIYDFIGQGSMQRQEGDLTLNEFLTFKTTPNLTGIFRVVGCSDTSFYTEQFKDGTFNIKLKNIYQKNYLTRSDSCDMEVLVIPNEIPESFIGRFSLNIFGKEIIKLENLSFEIVHNTIPANENGFEFETVDLEVKGASYILGCAINDKIIIKNSCSVPYKPDEIFWIKGFTTNGRKSIFAVKNGEVIWKE